jgi:hypothetical protein
MINMNISVNIRMVRLATAHIDIGSSRRPAAAASQAIQPPDDAQQEEEPATDLNPAERSLDNLPSGLELPSTAKNAECWRFVMLPAGELLKEYKGKFFCLVCWLAGNKFANCWRAVSGGTHSMVNHLSIGEKNHAKVCSLLSLAVSLRSCLKI